MKKTLITLLALTGVAAADTATLTVGTNTNSTWSSGVTFDLPDNAPITLEFVSITGNKGEGSEMREDNYIAANTGRIAPYIRFQEGKFDTYFDFKFSASASSTNAITVFEGISLTLNSITGNGVEHTQGVGSLTLTLFSGDLLTNYGSGTATLGANSASGTAAITMQNGIELNSTAQEYIIRVERTSGQNGRQGFVAIEGGSITYSTTPVPEPTTATLSLLALAGLAARRRRK